VIRNQISYSHMVLLTFSALHQSVNPGRCSQAIEGVPPVEEGYNPATWMLEVANNSVEHRTGQDFAALYANSDMSTCASPPPLESRYKLSHRWGYL